MKLKIAFTFFSLCFALSFGQDFENELASIKTLDVQIQEEQYSSDEIVSVDRFVVKTPESYIISKKDQQFFSKKEWAKIKRQLSKNKKRIIENNALNKEEI